LSGAGFFQGTLVAADIFGMPLADPLAAMQVILASGVVVPAYIISATGVSLFYFLLGGRTFCSWVCPVYLLTELGEMVRCQCGTGDRILPLETKRYMLLLVFVATLASGLPYFEILSPIGIVSRTVAFGSWSALLVVAGILVLEAFIARRVWCRSLCPLGGYYSLVGRYSPLRIRFAREQCTACGACTRICPVAEVLDPCLAGESATIMSGECTRCGACVDICREKALQVEYGFSS
jgi:ferredoxin-type protein NapH